MNYEEPRDIKVLHLTLKKKWFDMIASGEKKEEYREIKQYWNTRLKNKVFDVVRFRNGYAKDAPALTVALLDVHRSYGREDWGAPRLKTVWILKLGAILELKGKSGLMYKL